MKKSELRKTEGAAKKDAFLSSGYVKIPRAILMNCFSNAPEEEQNICLLHLVLMLLCNYSERSVVVNGKEVPCKRGEYEVKRNYLLRRLCGLFLTLHGKAGQAGGALR